MSLLLLTAQALALPLCELPDTPPGSPEARAAAALVGRKALSLADLTRHGLPVPAAGVITTNAYRQALAAPGLAGAVAHATNAPELVREAALAVVHQALLEAPLPEAVEQAIAATYRQLGGAVAVRSSGVAEDLEGASFAGLYETYLHVTGEAEVIEAVRRCWASAWSPRVATYARRQEIGPAEMAMAVVVQRMVDAEVAGVLFTLDPITGREEHMRVEACFGLGEALVAGKVQPDRFLIDRRTGKALETEIAFKGMKLARRDAGGVEEVALAEGAGRRPTLSAAQLAELARLGRAAQAYYGAPQDLEWALEGGKLQLVQSRPITTIAYTGIEGEWTTADFKDGGVAASVCAPYMASLYDRIFQHTSGTYLKGIKLLRHDRPIDWYRVFYGRPYWNVAEIKRCMTLVPGFNERHFDRGLGIEGAYDGDGHVTPTNLFTIAGALPVLFALQADYQRRLQANAEFVARFDAAIAPRYDADPAALEREALVARFRQLVLADYFETESTYFYTVYNVNNAKMDFMVELDKANRSAKPPLDVLTLLSGLKDVPHLEPLRDLWAIAGQIRGDAGLYALFTTTPAERLQDRLLASPHAPFWDVIARFLHAHRHHSVAELDITRPRWDEDPTFVLQTLQGYVAAHDPERDPDAIAERQHAAYQAERARAEAHFAARGFFAKRAGAAFFAQLDRVRAYAWWREALRDRSSRMYALVRRETLAVARLLSREGALAAPDDVWFLELDDLLALTDGRLPPEDARRLIAERREDFLGFRNFKNPNELGRRFKPGGPAPNQAPDGSLAGIPSSPGVVTARVRVIPTIQDGAALQAGEVLVTQFTDPGWTPLFSAIAGVVTETGGLLSHAAVIAREYGIPAVLAVPGATRALKTGDWVRLDGAAGTVTQVEPPEA